MQICADRRAHTCSACYEPSACFLDPVCESAVDADDARLLDLERAAEELAALLEDAGVQQAGLQLVNGDDRKAIDEEHTVRHRHPSARVPLCCWTWKGGPAWEDMP